MSVKGKPKSVFHFLESRVEGLINGLLGGSHAGQVQPVAVAHLLARHAEEDKLISLSNVYIPVRYLVYINPEDMTALGPIQSQLEDEFRRFLEEWAADRNYLPNGPISIELREREGINRGSITIVSSFSETLTPDARDEATGVNRDAMNAVGVLTVVEGPDAGAEFPVFLRRMVLGRVEDCDVQLRDTNASRRHAALFPEGDEWLVEDLGSTNGTLLNRRPIMKDRLHEGDLLCLGDTTLRFSLSVARPGIAEPRLEDAGERFAPHNGLAHPADAELVHAAPRNGG